MISKFEFRFISLAPAKNERTYSLMYSNDVRMCNRIWIARSVGPEPVLRIEFDRAGFRRSPTSITEIPDSGSQQRRLRHVRP